MAPQRKQKTVAVIDDEEVMLNLLTRQLTRAGYAVHTARDGEEGYALIAREKPDLVLLDMILPRMSGFTVLEKLNSDRILPDLPVVIISNSGQPIEIEQVLKLGVRDYVVKVNFDPDEIIKKVTHILGSGATETPTVAPQSIARALIVEDDTFLVELLATKLNRAHIQPFHARDAEHARSLLQKEKIDAILLDVRLPGIDGITFLTQLKADAALRHIPVIIVSNLSQEEEIQQGRAAGAAAYMVKANVTPDEIVAQLQEILTQH